MLPVRLELVRLLSILVKSCEIYGMHFHFSIHSQVHFPLPFDQFFNFNDLKCDIYCCVNV